MERSSGAAPPRHPGASGEPETQNGSVTDLLTMRIEETQDDVAVISLVGELDLGTAPRIERRMFTEIRRRRAVVVDLSELRFIDSSGIGLLIHAHRAREDGKAAELHAVVTKGSQVAKVFDLAGVDRALAVHSSQAEALAALNGRVPG